MLACYYADSLQVAGFPQSGYFLRKDVFRFVNTVAGGPTVTCRDCATRPHCLMAAVPDAELPLLEKQLRPIAFRKGAAIFRKGDRVRQLRIVRVGQVVGALPLGPVDRPILVSGRGWPIGLFALFDRPVGMTTIANAATSVCEIPIRAVQQLPSWEGNLRERATTLAFAHYQRLAEWSAALRHPATGARIAHCLALLHREDESGGLPMPSTVLWAQLVGAARETASRAISKLEEQGCFQRRDRLVDVDIAACERVYLHRSAQRADRPATAP